MRVRRVKQVDAGGQGTVWQAEVVDTGEQVAMKLLKANPASTDPDADVKRFIREVRCQSQLQHRGIVPVVATNTSADPPWYVMPWADATLRTDLASAGGSGLQEDDALDIFSTVLDAMVYAHGEGVLHRDLKPENVLMINGQAAISDFGLSRRLDSTSTTLTSTNVGLGTIAYSAPEQLTAGHDADERADVFALGKLLYEMLSGTMPFPAVELGKVPARFRYIIGKCTENDRDKRYDSVAELAREVKLLVEGSDTLLPALERASKLVEQLLDGDSGALAGLHRLLVENSEDLSLYTDFLPYLPEQAIKKYAKRNPSGLKAVIEHFDKFAAGGHPFSYTDVIADFLRLVYVNLDDDDLHGRILSRLLVLGSQHNRWHVGGVFQSLAAKETQTPQGVLLVAAVLRGHPGEKQFVAEGLRNGPLAKEINDALSE